MYHAEPAAIVNEAVTTQSVTSAPTEMSKPPTRSAFVWPIATSASGMVVSSRLLRLYSVRNASCATVAYAPRPTMSRPRKASGIQPRNLGAGGQRRGRPRAHDVVPPWSGDDLAPQVPRPDDGLDDPALAQLRRRDLVDDPATRHHDDAIAETRELERIARLDDDRHPLPRLVLAAPRRCRSGSRRRRPASARRRGSRAPRLAGTGA